ncbi:hypothetical protein SISSUDRAFT_1121271 [Sistotremastrum suecicum HHB10207 ss-3]|uniref:Uncharacterized protein n=1 Tax=Sistotremastrum suecicum HHB10207 ss-3 TaxID=1314776 RepID=A0A166B2L4_9AGAM|nr:hypothetical protein SISSUDRAFT_1121271 [Sistotremastrum suecicum HHB10207 ss-3]
MDSPTFDSPRLRPILPPVHPPLSPRPHHPSLPAPPSGHELMNLFPSSTLGLEAGSSPSAVFRTEEKKFFANGMGHSRVHGSAHSHEYNDSVRAVSPPRRDASQKIVHVSTPGTLSSADSTPSPQPPPSQPSMMHTFSTRSLTSHPPSNMSSRSSNVQSIAREPPQPQPPGNFHVLRLAPPPPQAMPSLQLSPATTPSPTYIISNAYDPTQVTMTQPPSAKRRSGKHTKRVLRVPPSGTATPVS